MFKRILPAAGAVGLLSVALAGTAMAGGGGGYSGPGHFQFTDTAAYATFGDPYSGSYASNVYVDRGQLSFKLKRTPGAPVVEKYGTVLRVNEYSATTAEYGCWIIPDSTFVMARDLSSASVNVHATADMQCPGIFVGSAAGGKPGLQSAIGYGGGGGGEPPTVITDINVSLSWAGNGGLWHNSNSSTSRCGSYNANFHSTFDYEYSTASGTVGDVTGPSDPFAQVSRNALDSNSSSTPSGACNPFGF